MAVIAKDEGSPAEPNAHPSRTAWVTLAILVLLYILSFLDRQILAMMVDPIRRDLGISDFEVSLLMGFSFALFYTIFGVFMGGIVDRHSRRTVVYVGVSLWSLATAACGLAQSFWQLFLCRMLVGVGESTLTPASYSMLTDLFPRRRLAFALAIFTLGTTLGAGLSMVLGGFVISLVSKTPFITLPLIGDIRAWQVVFFLIGLPGLLAACLMFAVPEPARTGRLKGSGTPSWKSALQFLMTRRKLWLAIILSFAPSATLSNAIVLWAPAYMGRNFGWSPLEVGLAIGGVVAITGGVGQMLSGWTVDALFSRGMRDAHFRFLGWMTIIAIPALVLAFLTTSVPLFLTLLAVPFLLLLSNAGYGAAAIQMTTPNEYRGRMGALFILVVTIPSMILGPSLIALLSEKLFRSEQSLGLSIALTAAIMGPIMLVGVSLGKKAMRELMTETPAPSA
ncbi:MFS transporter [Sphingobium sp. Sx8-8]|uniref:MFS transporter n=1 Tax=Sphingobium sp. Sx8-8 TaxID=2933617 RepID=UPI001F5780C4|nr:MFS transporter [Sphingobium sp. Sx8-8]